jgi:hypothetical protein
MSQITPYVQNYSYQSELGTTFGTHLDTEFIEIANVTSRISENLALIQRDDGMVRNQTVHSNAFSSDALALIAGQQNGDNERWTPRGDWLTGTVYEVTDVIEEGSPATAYVCTVQHIAGTFAVDYAAGKWVVLSAPRTLVSADVTTALGFTPVNKAGDTMTGALTMITGSKMGGASGMTFTDTLLATQALITVDKGWYATFAATLAATQYGFASNIVRTAQSQATVGGQFSAYTTGALSGATTGAIANGLGLSGHLSALYGLQVAMMNANPNATTAKRGFQVTFQNRGEGFTNPGQYSWALPFATYSNAGAGLGSNFYNRDSVGVLVTSQQATATGEYCGWSRGIAFDEYALDYATETEGVRAAIALDFSGLHYYGGSDPTPAYHMEAAIAMRDLQGIWWNRDPADPADPDKVKTLFNIFTGRWSLTLAGTEKFGVDVNTGTIYSNGVAISGVSLSGTNTWTGTNTFNAFTNFAAGVTFSGINTRIQGDFAGATVSQRTLFANRTSPGNTEVGAVPTGASVEAGFYALSANAANNCQAVRIAVNTTNAVIQSYIVGAASYVPLSFDVNGSEAMRLNTAQQLLIGTTSAPVTGAKLRVNGIVQCDNPVAFMVHRNDVDTAAVAHATPTVVTWTTEAFDTGSVFAANTFTPPAGKYHLEGACLLSNADATIEDDGLVVCLLYKNGALHKAGNYVPTRTAAGAAGSAFSCVVDANGTDAFTMRLYQESPTSATKVFSGLITNLYFSGHRVG